MKHCFLISLLFLMASFCHQTFAATDKVYHINTSDSVSLYVHVKGEGPACLYLHGGPGSGSTWMEELAGKRLESQFTMVYLDQRGVCKSSAPENEDYSFDRQIQDWEEVREVLGLKSWILMGHSWGGILEMGYWQKHPERIEGMIFVNCTLSCGTSFEESWLPKAISIVGDKANPLALDNTKPLMERMMAIAPQLNNDNRWELFTPNKWANDTINSWSFHKDCITHGKGEIPMSLDEYWQDFRAITTTVDVPVLYLYGQQDYAVGPNHYKGLHFPDAIVQGANCGHMVFLEEPEIFSDALVRFKKKYEHKKLLEDYDYFIEKLEEIHPNPYSSFGSKDAFSDKVNILRESLSNDENLSASKLQSEVSKLLIPLHDGHTYCGYQNLSRSDSPLFPPIKLNTTSDGLYISATIKQYEYLLGAKVERFGGLTIDEVLDRVSLLTTAENEYGLYKKFLESDLASPLLDLILDGFDGNSLSLDLTLMDGEFTSISLPMYSYDDMRNAEVVKTKSNSRFPTGNLEFGWADKKKGVMTFKCTHVISRDCLEFMKDSGMEYQSSLEWAFGDKPLESIPSITERFNEMLLEMKKAKAQHLIIDLRGNGGGWTPIVYATLYQLYGDEYLKKNMDITFETKISEQYLLKNVTTLEEFNKQNGSDYKIGDFVKTTDGDGVSFVDDSIRESIIDGYICSAKDLLKKQNGKPVYHPKHVYVVTDEDTFSAAFHYTFMLWKMGATIVGIPSSQAPNTFMEVTDFRLPYSGISCSVSNSTQVFLPSDDVRAKVLYPDWMMTYENFKDYNFDKQTSLLYILDHLKKRSK